MDRYLCQTISGVIIDHVDGGAIVRLPPPRFCNNEVNNVNIINYSDSNLELKIVSNAGYPTEHDS